VTHQTLVVLDFGSQFTQLIARRLRELSIYSEILPYNTPLAEIRARNPVGIVLSGGPRSVSEASAPRCHAGVFDAGVPVLGICYGMQLMTDMLGGEVAPAPHREYGHAMVTVAHGAPMLASVGPSLRVWASHGDFVKSAPPGFTVTATSSNAPVAAMADEARRYFAILFHPEVAHTDKGTEILRNFAFDICGCTGDWTMASFVEETVAKVRAQVGAMPATFCVKLRNSAAPRGV
jgi:GMP synthase (glutamine-hydrolysing)